MAHAFAGLFSIYQVIEGGIAKEVDDIETASDATKRNDIEEQVAREIAERFTEIFREHNERAEKFLVEEEAARAGTAFSSSELSKWYRNIR